MKTNRGIAAELVLIYILFGTVVALFVPNKFSTALGLGNRQNKIVQTERVELIKQHGEIVGTKTVSESSDEQQKITFWEWLWSLPIFVLILMLLGIIFPPVALVFARLRSVWKSAFKNQFNGLKNLPDTTVTCRKCGDPVTIDTKEKVFDNIVKKMDNRDQVLQERVRTELTK